MTSHDTPDVRSHTFDGIQEFDNRLPNWWLWTFYLACIFSVVYWVHYHVLGTGDLPGEEYRLELQAAADKAMAAAPENITDEFLAKLATDATVVSAGKAVWMANCIACHKEDGGGSVGPNMTDKFWIHGGSPSQMYHTVVNGVVEKGMLAWKPILGAKKCQQVVAFLQTIKNTNAPGGKAPEGTEEGQ